MFGKQKQNPVTKPHVISESQSRRIGIRAGTTVQVEMYNESEIVFPEQRHIAKGVYVNGNWAGGILDLED